MFISKKIVCLQGTQAMHNICTLVLGEQTQDTQSACFKQVLDYCPGQGQLSVGNSLGMRIIELYLLNFFQLTKSDTII